MNGPSGLPCFFCFPLSGHPPSSCPPKSPPAEGQTGRSPAPSPPPPGRTPAPASSSGHSTISSSWTWRTSRPSSPSVRSRSRTRSMASLMMSAAVPWMGMFRATRSPKERSIEVGGLQLRQPPAAAEQGGDIAVLLGPLHHLGPYRPAPRNTSAKYSLHILLGLRHRSPRCPGTGRRRRCRRRCRSSPPWPGGASRGSPAPAALRTPGRR